jgi:hypothetical protein
MAIVVAEMSTAYLPVGTRKGDLRIEENSYDYTWLFRDRKTREPHNFAGYAGEGYLFDSDGNQVAVLTIDTLADDGKIRATLATLPAAGHYSYCIKITSGAIKKTTQVGPFRILNKTGGA